MVMIFFGMRRRKHMPSLALRDRSRSMKYKKPIFQVSIEKILLAAHSDEASIEFSYNSYGDLSKTEESREASPVTYAYDEEGV